MGKHFCQIHAGLAGLVTLFPVLRVREKNSTFFYVIRKGCEKSRKSR